jgi:hypothetical protein
MAAHPVDATTLVVSVVQGVPTYTTATQKVEVAPPNLQPGRLVLLKEENQPPMQCKMGVVEQVFPGKDSTVQVVTVRCS